MDNDKWIIFHMLYAEVFITATKILAIYIYMGHVKQSSIILLGLKSLSFLASKLEED